MRETQNAHSPQRLMNKNFFLLWQGQLVSGLGSAVFYVGIIFWIKHATGSASIMGLMMMLFSLPEIVLGPVGGTFADRHSRRAIIINSDILNGLNVLLLSGFLFFIPNRTELIIMVILALSIMSGMLSAFFRPAVAAAIPDIVPRKKISSANSLSRFSIQLSTFVGQGVGGIMYRLLGAPILSLVNGLTFLFSAGSEFFITIPQNIPEKGNGLKETMLEFLRDLKEGMNYVWQKQGLKQFIIGVVCLNFFVLPIMFLLPFYVEDFLGLKSDWYGYLISGFGLGAVIGYLLAGTLKLTGKRTILLSSASLIGGSILMGGLAFIRTSYIALIIIGVFGVLNGLFNIIWMTILQTTTPSQIRGRVLGLVSTLVSSASPLAMGSTGIVADLTGQNIPLMYIVCGIMMALISIILTVNKDFRVFLGTET